MTFLLEPGLITSPTVSQNSLHEKFLRQAIRMAETNVAQGRGGPFGALVVKNGQIVGQGCNNVTPNNDPTAHAEVMAIRDACKNLGSYQLTDCDIYTSCEPCPMCLGAIYWARPRAIYYASGRDAAAAAGFDDAFIYEELGKPLAARKFPIHQILAQEGAQVFNAWDRKSDKVRY
ncbi:MAG: nucleoside deaminase [Bdellovibrionales bacterium]|nr:nucleoside deaminase [Bdellovibrionales bacterium]